MNDMIRLYLLFLTRILIATSELKKLHENIPNFAVGLKCDLENIFKNSTAYQILLEDLRSSNLSCTPLSDSDIGDILDRIIEQTEKLINDTEGKLTDKTDQVERYVREDFRYNPDDVIPYYDADFKRRGLLDKEDGYNFKIRRQKGTPYPSTAQSTAHYIPVVKVNSSSSVLHDIAWTWWMNGTAGGFNHFIGTTNGILAFYPAVSWPSKHDMYDCRLQSWFLQAASLRHDIAFLIDRSGSVSGITLRTIQRIAKLLLNIIPENYWLNVFLFNNETVPLIPCYGSYPLPAKDEIKKTLLEKMDGIEASMPGYLDLALRSLQKTFFNRTEKDATGCPHKRLILLFTDGMIDFNTETIKSILQDMRVQLIVLDFSSPISPGRNKKLKDMACDVGEHYLFVKRISDWFKVADIFINTTVSFAVNFSAPESHRSNRNDQRVQWGDPIRTFYDRKSVILSMPIFNRSRTSRGFLRREVGDESAKLIGVMGTEITLIHFSNSIARDYGSLMYDVIMYNDTRILRHPRLGEAKDVPYLDQIEPVPQDHGRDRGDGNDYPTEQLYPLPDILRSPVTKMYRIVSRRRGRLVYQLRVPQNDGYRMVIPSSSGGTEKKGRQELRYRYREVDDLMKRFHGTVMFILSTSHQYFSPGPGHSAGVFVRCSPNRTISMEKICKEYMYRTSFILQDVLLANRTVSTWLDNSTGQTPAQRRTLGNFLYTRHGVLFTTQKHSDTPNPNPLASPEWVNFAADPDRYPPETLMITAGSDKGSVNLTKAVTMETENGNAVVHSIVGTTLKPGIFERLVRSRLYMHKIEKDTIRTVLLDHHGQVIFTSSPKAMPLHAFYGEVNGAAFNKLLERGYFVDKIFKDCLHSCEVRSSSGRRALPLLHSLGSLVAKVVGMVLRSLFVTSPVRPPIASAFIKPDIGDRETRCCREVHAYERDFGVMDMFVDTYNRCAMNESCMETVAVAAVADTNLLVVAVIPNLHCHCIRNQTHRHGNTEVYDDCEMKLEPYNGDAHTNQDRCYKETNVHANTGECYGN